MREKEFLPLVKEKLGIETLNPMQRRMMEAASEKKDIVLLSPTGSGKTLAFVLPMLKMLKPSSGRVQCVVVAPSRELVIQITGIIRPVAACHKVTPLYGGHKVDDEVNSLSVVPDIIVATPGRLADHLHRRNTDIITAGILVLDEFDKTLELGFEQEMKTIAGRLKNLNRTILTSATGIVSMPGFIRLDNPLTLDYRGGNKELRSRLAVHEVISEGKDKLAALLLLLNNINKDSLRRTIIFVNHRESAERVAAFLKAQRVSSVLYHGALDQIGREKAIAMFNNGSFPILVSTDLASRGLDIADVAAVIHYHQPLTAEAYTHRNGRTARVGNKGDIYVLVGPGEDLKPWIGFDDTFHLDPAAVGKLVSDTATVFFSAGKKEKLSKGDIAGFLIKEGGYMPAEIGRIDVFDHYALASVPANDAAAGVRELSSKKIKGTKRELAR